MGAYHSNDLLFDDEARKRSQKRAARHFKDHDFLFQHVCDDLIERLSLIKGDIKDVLCLGTRVPPSFKTALKNRIGLERLSFEEPDTLLHFKKRFDCVISPLSLHNVNHLPAILKHIRDSLKPNGVFLAAFPGEKTLHELKTSLMETENVMKNGVSPHILPFISQAQMGEHLLQAGFTLPVIDRDILTVTYNTIYTLMHDLRYMGESNILTNRNKTNLGKAFFKQVQKHYHKHFAQSDERLPATFDFMYLIGWTKENDS